MPEPRDPLDPDESERGWTDGEIEMAVHYRARITRIPGPGERVLYRHDHHGDITDALVVAVQPWDDKTDPNLWVTDRETGERIHLRDPWPTLTLDTLFGRVDTREARVRGSAGWLPLDFPDRH